MNGKRAIFGAFAVAVLLLTTACSASVSTSRFMDEEDVERQISESLTKETGAKPDKIDCPGDLKGKVDATMRCILTAGTEELGLTVTVTEFFRHHREVRHRGRRQHAGPAE